MVVSDGFDSVHSEPQIIVCMEDSFKNIVHDTLTKFLNERHLRKTPERYAILDAITSFEEHFTLEELNDKLEMDFFRVSRATLYNTMQLFLKIPLVACHKFPQHTVYENIFAKPKHCYQVCRVCGKVTEINAAQIETVIDLIKTKRFHKESFTIEIHGICSTCYAKMHRKKRKTNNINKKNNEQRKG